MNSNLFFICAWALFWVGLSSSFCLCAESTDAAAGPASLVLVGFSLLGRSVGVESLFIALWESLGRAWKLCSVWSFTWLDKDVEDGHEHWNRLLLVELARVYCSLQDCRQTYLALAAILDHVISWLSLLNCSLSLSSSSSSTSIIWYFIYFKVFYFYFYSFNTCKALAAPICLSIQISYPFLGSGKFEDREELRPWWKKAKYGWLDAFPRYWYSSFLM